jgi:hypothetical protein
MEQVYKIKDETLIQFFKKHFEIIRKIDAISELSQNKELSDLAYQIGSMMGWLARHLEPTGK